MNILVFSTVFYPGIGGIENQTLLLLREFIKNGHHVKVITYQKQFVPLPDMEVYNDPSIIQKIKLFFWCHTYYMPNISLKGVWPLLLNKICTSKKKWVISHNDFYLSNLSSNTVKFKRFLLKYASKNIAVSSSVANYLHSNATIIYNCYDDAIFKRYPDEVKTFDFVFLGRLVSQKGCDDLIKACKHLNQSFTLNIIGKGPEEQRLKKLVNELQLNEQIKFLGAISGEELARTLNRHRTMVVPAKDNEGFGMVVLEGLACGCNIIASNAAGLIEAVDCFGKIYNMNDIESLSKLMQQSLVTKSDNVKISAPLQNYLFHHTRSAVSNQYLEQFKQQ